MIVDLLTLLSFLLVAFAVFLIGNLILTSRSTPDPQFGEDRQANLLTRAFARAVPQLSTEVESIGRDLKRAGNYRRAALDEYLATRNALILATFLLTLMAAFAFSPDPSLFRTVVIMGFVLAIAAYGLPRLYLGWVANNRVDRIESGLPDALDMTTMCLTGGLPLYDALQRVGPEIRHTHPDVADEFDVVRRQAIAGSMGTALTHFAQRVDSPDIRALASIVMQTERLGTNIARALRDYSESVRNERQQRAVERANRMTVMMMLPIIFCLSPPVYLLLCGPPVLELASFFEDREFLGAAEDAIASQRTDNTAP